MVNIKLDISIEGIHLEARKDLLIVRSENPLKVLSSAVLNGGFHVAKAIINHRVPKNFDHADPEGYLKNVVESVKIPPDHVVGLMTAADVRNVAVATQRRRDLIVSAVVTAGLLNPAKAGEVTTTLGKYGTINIILLVDGNPTESCMVDAIKTATESKSAALREFDIRSLFSGELASGTTTDAIVVASTMRGELIRYAGTVTELGEMIGMSVNEAVKEAIRKQEAITPDRPLAQRLRERGIEVKDLINTALELFVPHPEGIKKGEALRLLKEGFERTLSDTNVAALVMAGLRLAEDGQYGLIPNLPSETFRKDPRFLVADEILGMAIADYIAGSRGIFELVRFNKIKPGILKRLDPISDDIIAGLIAGVSSNMYTHAASQR